MKKKIKDLFKCCAHFQIKLYKIGTQCKRKHQHKVMHLLSEQIINICFVVADIHKLLLFVTAIRNIFK